MVSVNLPSYLLTDCGRKQRELYFRCSNTTAAKTHCTKEECQDTQTPYGIGHIDHTLFVVVHGVSALK